METLTKIVSLPVVRSAKSSEVAILTRASKRQTSVKMTVLRSTDTGARKPKPRKDTLRAPAGLEIDFASQCILNAPGAWAELTGNIADDLLKNSGNTLSRLMPDAERQILFGDALQVVASVAQRLNPADRSLLRFTLNLRLHTRWKQLQPALFYGSVKCNSLGKIESVSGTLTPLSVHTTNDLKMSLRVGRLTDAHAGTHILEVLRTFVLIDQKTNVKLHLTPRQQQVVALMRDKLTSAQIAEVLCLGVRTVEKYRLQMHRRFGTHLTVDLLAAIDAQIHEDDHAIPSIYKGQFSFE